MRMCASRSSLIAAAIAFEMPLVGRARVDDGDVAAADDIAIGAEEGVGARDCWRRCA